MGRRIGACAVTVGLLGAAPAPLLSMGLFLKPPPEAVRKPVPLTYEEQERTVIDKEALLVVHATEQFQGAARVKPAVDSEIDDFKRTGRPVIYLMDSLGRWEAQWYTADDAPTVAGYSTAGEHFFSLHSDRATLIGGYFKACFANALEYSSESYFASGGKRFTFDVPMNAVYATSNRSLKEVYEDTYGTDPKKFLPYVATFLSNRSKLSAHRWEISIDGERLSSGGGATRTIQVRFFTD